ncbi:MAG TPA: hypothetical protein VI953_01400 [Candidatus Paceibacterota bacterium]
MKNFFTLLSGFKRVFRHKKRASLEHHIINSDRDWRLILIIFFLGLIASAASHYIIFIKFDVVPVDVTDEAPPVMRFLLKDGLVKAVGEYRAKETSLNALMESRPTVVDPSK